MKTTNEALQPSFDGEILFGIPVTVLNGVIFIKEGDEEYVQIASENELAAAVAVARALHPVSLHGKDVVALRKACEMSAVKFAEMLGMSPSTLSRIESNTQAMGPHLEKLIRIYVAEKLSYDAVGITYPGARAVIEMKLEDGSLVERVRLTFEKVRLRNEGETRMHYVLAS